MPKPCSLDLRMRLLEAVIAGQIIVVRCGFFALGARPISLLPMLTTHTTGVGRHLLLGL